MPDSRSRSFAVLTVLLFAAVATGQTDTVWVRRLSGTGNGNDRVAALATDPAGNVYAAILNSPSDTTTATITVKYSPDGELLWSRRFAKPGDVTPEDIVVGHDGSVFVVGTYYDGYGDDIVLLKYTGSGDSCWVRYYDGTGFDDIAAAVLADESGNVYVAGTSETDDYEDMLLIKYSSSGEEQWARLYDYQHEEDFGLALVMDRQGYIYEAGAVMNWHGGGHFDLSVLKYSPDGVLQWARAFSGPGMNEDSAVALAVDPQNNLLVAGCTSPNFDSSGYLVVKYSPSGDTLWSRSFVDRGDEHGAVAIGTDSLGNVVLAGNHDYAFLTVKYSPAGAELWRRYYHGPREGDSLCGMKVGPLGNIYVTGWSTVSRRIGSGDDIATVKYSPSGDELWVRRWCAPDSLDNRGLALVLAGNGICVGGWYYHRRSYSTGYLNGVTVRYDQSGNEQWTTSFSSPGPSPDVANDVVFDADGNVLAVGYLDMTNEGQDLAVAKYSPAGELLWLRTYGNVRARNDVATAVAADRWNNVYVTGHSEGESTGRDYVTLKYDPDGNQLWVMRYDGPAHADDTTVGLAVDRSGNVVVTGQSYGVGTDLDYATVRYTSGGRELWVRRHNGSADSRDRTSGVAVDSTGAVYVTGTTEELGRGFPATTIKYDLSGSVLWILECEDPDPHRSDFWPKGAMLGPAGNLYLGGGGYRCHLGAKIDQQGETLWVRAASRETSWVASQAVAVADDGRLFVTGYIPQDDYYDYATSAFGPDGEVLWQRTYGGGFLRVDAANDVAVGPEGRVFVTGKSQSDWFLDATTICYDSLGNVVWMDSYGIGNTLYEKGMALAVGPNGRVAVVGSGGGFSDYDLLTVIYEPRIGLAEPGGSLQPARPLSLEVHPNPSVGPVRFMIRAPGSARVSLQVYDRMGRLVRTLAEGSGCSGLLERQWDGTDIYGDPVPGGVYFAKVAWLEKRPGSWSPRRSVVKKVVRGIPGT